jgi:F-type H+-transporting ATPase subunit a
MYLDIKTASKWLCVAMMGLLPSLMQAADGVSVAPYDIHFLGPIPITNSMIMGWVISLVLVLLVRFAVRKRALVPGRAQGALEVVVEGVSGLVEPIVGKKMLRPTLPLLIAFFCFILFHNWSGLLPGVGTFGKLKEETVEVQKPVLDEHGNIVHHEQVVESKEKLLYYMRPANADLNMTLALALVSFVAWCYYCIRYAGFKVIFYDLFGNKSDKKETPAPVYMLLFVIFFGVGLIEIISILFRPVSLSFRLFGNVFGGENLLHAMTHLGGIGVLLPIPFYFLEVLIGLIQALVFTILVAVYIGLICNHGDEHGEEHH